MNKGVREVGQQEAISLGSLFETPRQRVAEERCTEPSDGFREVEGGEKEENRGEGGDDDVGEAERRGHFSTACSMLKPRLSTELLRL